MGVPKNKPALRRAYSLDNFTLRRCREWLVTMSLIF